MAHPSTRLPGGSQAQGDNYVESEELVTK